MKKLPRSALVVLALPVLAGCAPARSPPGAPAVVSAAPEAPEVVVERKSPSPFRVIAEGANGNDEGYEPGLALCPVRGATLLCGLGGVRRVSASEGVISVMPELGHVIGMHGSWPDALWVIARVGEDFVVRQRAASVWKDRLRLGKAASVSHFHLGASWSDGGLAVATGGFEFRGDREVSIVVLRTISKDGVVVERSLGEHGGRLVTHVSAIHALGASDLLLAGQTGGRGVLDGKPAIFVWRGNQRAPRRVRQDDAGCEVGGIFGDRDDVRLFGVRDGYGGALCGFRFSETGLTPVELPQVHGTALSYTRAKDGVEWLTVEEVHNQKLGRSSLWSKRPQGAWERLSLPAPALARTTRWGAPQPREVHADEDGRIWIGAVYRERCGRALILATDATAAPCRLGWGAVCEASADSEWRGGACPEIKPGEVE